MRFSNALNLIANNSVTEIQSLSDILETNIVNEGLLQSSVAAIRR